MLWPGPIHAGAGAEGVVRIARWSKRGRRSSSGKFASRLRRLWPLCRLRLRLLCRLCRRRIFRRLLRPKWVSVLVRNAGRHGQYASTFDSAGRFLWILLTGKHSLQKLLSYRSDAMPLFVRFSPSGEPLRLYKVTSTIRVAVRIIQV